MLRRFLLGATVVAQLISARLDPRHEPAMTRGIVGLMVASAVAAPRGRARAATAGTIGYGAELVGVATGKPFGHYSYTAKLGPGAGGVPFAVGACWAMLAGPSWAVACTLSERPAARAAIAAGAIAAWDVAVDPRMVREGYWRWPQGGTYEGIPATNFLGWLGVGGLVFATWSALDPDPEPDDEGLALYVWSWVGEIVANLLFWRRPRVAAAAGVAMGVLAVPALRRRLRA